MDKQYQFSDGTSITLTEIEYNNAQDEILTFEEIECLSELEIGDTYQTLTRTR